MRRSFVVLAAALACGFGPWQTAHGQDEAAGVSDIRVTTALHDDGSKTVTQVDADNHTSEASTYNAADKLLRKVTYTLDDQNQPLQGIVYDAKGRELYKSVYKRDGSGRITEEMEYTPDDRVLGRFLYQYNGEGRLVKIVAYDAEGNLVSQNGATAQQNQSLPRRNR